MHSARKARTQRVHHKKGCFRNVTTALFSVYRCSKCEWVGPAVQKQWQKTPRRDSFRRVAVHTPYNSVPLTWSLDVPFRIRCISCRKSCHKI